MATAVMATIRDVAKLAGVSVATVSNALNLRGNVSPDIKERVANAVEMLGYAPHAGAQRLRRSASNLIGVVIADIANPHFGALAEELESSASGRGYSVIICNSGEDLAREKRHLQTLLSHRVDGIVLIAAAGDSNERIAMLSRIGVPLAVVDRAIAGLSFDTVTLDDRRAGALVAEHLIGLGHRRIGVVSGPEGVSTARERLEGFREALASVGVPLDPRLVIDGGFRADRARSNTQRLLASAERPTAIFATDLMMALGVLSAVGDAGLVCPLDISVAAIGDNPFATALHPGLTTVAQPVNAIAAAAIEALLASIARSNDEPETSTRIALEPRLIVRGSTGAPQAGVRR